MSQRTGDRGSGSDICSNLGCSLGSGGHCGVGGQEAGMKLGREGTRRSASPSKEKGREQPDHCVVGQVALVPQRTQLCQGFSELDPDHGL